MTAKNRFRSRVAARKAMMDETFARWALATKRGERVAKDEVQRLLLAMLTRDGAVSIEDLALQHRANAAIPIRQALAEVEEYHKDAAQRLRDQDVLVYPVTEVGFVSPNPPDPTKRSEVIVRVPGMGRAQSVYGYRLAETRGDPVFIAYWDMRLNHSAGGYRKAEAAANAAAAKGITSGPIAPTVLPSTIDPTPPASPPAPKPPAPPTAPPPPSQ